MIKIQDKNAKLFLSLVFGALIVVGLMIATRPKNSENPSTSATITSRVYSNDLLDFSVVVPADFSVKTIAGFADFEKNNLKINQFRNCTNYDNLKDHVALQDERSGATHDTREFISINGYETAVEEVFSNPSKNYQIFAKQCIYIFSTNHPELYNDLDSIANSFQYTGK